MGPEAPDILPPLPPSTGESWIDWPLLAVAITALGFGLWYRHYRIGRPLRRLRRALRRRRLAPRQAAHALAALLRDSDGPNPGTELLGELDGLRFRRQAPSTDRLLSLIGRIEKPGPARPERV